MCSSPQKLLPSISAQTSIFGTGLLLLTDHSQGKDGTQVFDGFENPMFRVHHVQLSVSCLQKIRFSAVSVSLGGAVRSYRREGAIGGWHVTKSEWEPNCYMAGCPSMWCKASWFLMGHRITFVPPPPPQLLVFLLLSSFLSCHLLLVLTFLHLLCFWMFFFLHWSDFALIYPTFSFFL